MMRFGILALALLCPVASLPMLSTHDSRLDKRIELSNPACSGTEFCPTWPVEFKAPFGLYSFLPAIVNASSFFYYTYTEELQAQLVDYVEKCSPFTTVSTFFASSPCRLYFTVDGVFLHQPGRNVQCCLLTSDAAPPPPAFLRGYTLSRENVTAQDLYGQAVTCDEWDGGDGFKHWTVSRLDRALGRDYWGRPVASQQGPVGVSWRWGRLESGPQDSELFNLPSDTRVCSQSCSVVIGEEAAAALLKAPEVQMAVAAGRRRSGPARAAAAAAATTASGAANLPAAAAAAAGAEERLDTRAPAPAAPPAGCRAITEEDKCGAGCQWCVTIDLEWCQPAGKPCKE